MANNQNLIPPQKGEPSRNPHGRPKKLVSRLIAQGYRLSEINDCVKVMLSLTMTQLIEAKLNPVATALELLIISAIQADIKKGSLSVFETLISRSFGKPKETLLIETQPEIEAARALYETLLEKGLPAPKALRETLRAAKVNGFDLSPDDVLNADIIG